MKITKLIPIIVIVLVALVALFFVKGSRKDQMQVPEPEGAVRKTDDEGESLTGNLLDLLKLGRSVKCTGSYSSEDGGMEMTVYASGKKSYSEMELDMGSEGKLKTYSIFDGDWMYNWNDAGTATKMKVSDMEELAEDMPAADDYETQEEQTQAFQQKFDYKCVSWVSDNSKFTPPSGVEFMDVTQTMKDITEAMESGNVEDLMDSGCSACDMIPDAAQKAECKASLGCE